MDKGCRISIYIYLCLHISALRTLIDLSRQLHDVWVPLYRLGTWCNNIGDFEGIYICISIHISTNIYMYYLHIHIYIHIYISTSFKKFENICIDEESYEEKNKSKSSYQPVSFSMVLRSTVTPVSSPVRVHTPTKPAVATGMISIYILMYIYMTCIIYIYICICT
jgi:hypothetical protein